MTPERLAAIKESSHEMQRAGWGGFEGKMIDELIAEIERKDATLHRIVRIANNGAAEYEERVTSPFSDTVPRVSCAASIRGFASVAWEGINPTKENHDTRTTHDTGNWIFDTINEVAWTLYANAGTPYGDTEDDRRRWLADHPDELTEAFRRA